ncbi:CDP-alcohol phosphatidyltransferase family protein [Sphingosinicellaceae bacterium]|nr:CDP-alcohol phosphatidyltransferase family protein [Sphingosinicellaceae bacterium]
MPLIALLAAAPEVPLAPLLTVVGQPVLQRQVRQAAHAKAQRVIVVGGPMLGVEAVPTLNDAAALIGEGDFVLMLAPGLVVDERIVAAVIAAAPAVATFVDRGVERIDATALAAGIAVYSGALVRRVILGLGDWDLDATLLRAAVGDNIARVDLDAMDLYAPARRRIVPLTWALPEDVVQAEAAASMVIKAAQKGCLDWPARFIHPPIEDGLVRLLGPTPITPNMVTLLVAAISLAAGVAFATGWLWTGLILALVSGPLDGVDGKLARARVEFSRWGDLEHVLDKIAEYGWYFALAGHFAVTRGEGPWVVAVLIIVVALAEALGGEFFRRFTGSQLDDAGEFERRFRLVSGRRNTYFWTLIPFAAFGAWYAGFVMIAAYAVLTFFVMQARLYRRLGEFGRRHSPVVAANYAATTYDFLPAGKA